MSSTVEAVSGAPLDGEVPAPREPAPVPLRVVPGGRTAGEETDTSAQVLALLELREELDALSFPLRVGHAETAGPDRARALHQIDDYLLPRLRTMHAPVLAVVGGSTGAGKSTLVNSLLRVEVTRSGVLRPTTRAPVLVHHPSDGSWFRQQNVLPGLARDIGLVDEPAAGRAASSMRLVSSDTLPAGLALLDAPDVDSVVDSNRALAAQLLGAADLWVFVTTAARYADAVPWQFLAEAAERSVAVCLVLNRVPPDAIAEVRRDLAGMLARYGLGATPVFAIEETPSDSGMLPRAALEPLAAWLRELGEDSKARGMVVRRTLTGALDALRKNVVSLSDAADEQARAASRLIEFATDAHRRAIDRFAAASSDGTMLRGEVLSRWQDVVGTGDLMRQVEEGVSRLRDRLAAFVNGRPSAAERLGDSLGTATHTLLTSLLSAARTETARAWSNDQAGEVLMREDPQLGRVPDGLAAAVDRLVRDWQGEVLRLVTEEGAGKRRAARVVSLGVNGAGVVLMLLVFSQTGGVSGAEAGVAAGTAALSQRLLEAIFGDQAVRAMAQRAHADLLTRVESLLLQEQGRWLSMVPVVTDGERVRAVASRLGSAA